ncbi:hypothetical protein G9A89_009330 [Geosiphon pyriformis]|nr:hypothetical protein G9A89_009330 [Geosiphon pyriformis]
MAKLLNAVASKLGVTVEKKMKTKHNLEEGKETYNPEKEINEIKKALEPIMILLKQVEKQGNWNSAMAGESNV